jgi:hypothetical protein
MLRYLRELNYSPLLRRPWRAAKAVVFRFRRLVFNLLRTLPPPLSLGFPRGVYSDYELLLTTPPSLPGRIVLTDQGNPRVSPDSIMVLSRRRHHLEQPWPIFWTHHRDIELIGTSLAHIKNGLVCSEAVYGRSRVTDDPAYKYRVGNADRPVNLQGNWTSLVSRWMSTDEVQPYAHWVLDALPRLALLSEFPPDLKILLPFRQLPFQVASLQMLGLLDRCRWTKEKHLRLENYYFSSPTTMIDCYNPYAVNWLRKTFLPLVNVARPTPKRFFIRRFGNNRNMTNESKVLDLFRELGWEIIDAGAWSFPDQIWLFSNAEAICGIHGSGFTNVVWCQPGCRILEIYCSKFMGAAAEWISQCLSSVEHHHLIFPSDNVLNAVVDLHKLKETLQSLKLA